MPTLGPDLWDAAYCGGAACQMADGDDAHCQSYGAKPGSDAHVNCRAGIDNQRSANAHAADPAVAGQRALILALAHPFSIASYSLGGLEHASGPRPTLLYFRPVT